LDSPKGLPPQLLVLQLALLQALQGMYAPAMFAAAAAAGGCRYDELA
jgi:hypothetical protein